MTQLGNMPRMNLKTKMRSSQPVIMDENLTTVYHHCVYNLDSVHPYTIPDIHFEFDGASWVCSRALPHPLTFATVSSVPILESALIFKSLVKFPHHSQSSHKRVNTRFRLHFGLSPALMLQQEHFGATSWSLCKL